MSTRSRPCVLTKAKEFDHYLADHGIRRQLTTAHTPSQDGVAERKNRSVMEMGSTMLEHSGLPRRFWAEAVCYSGSYSESCIDFSFTRFDSI